jgi:hypothetical protein
MDGPLHKAPGFAGEYLQIFVQGLELWTAGVSKLPPLLGALLCPKPLPQVVSQPFE